MRIFFVVMFVTLYTSLLAQDSWPEIGTKWYYSIRENPFGSAATGYLKFEVSKDTIVEGQSCRILEKTQYTTDSKIINVGKEFIYSDNNKLYHFQKDDFYLLYDYSLEATDTFQIKLYYPAQSIDTIMNIVVDSVSTVEIDDSLLKKFYYRPVEGSLSGWRFGGNVIEKVGNLDYFFPYNEIDCDVGACAGPLRCYQDGAISFKQGFFDCEELYTRLDEVQSNENSFDLFPNPAADYLNLKLKGFSGPDVCIRIFNNYSQLVSSGYYLVNNDLVTIDVKELANNIYFIQVISKDKVESKQFVKLE